LRGGESLFDALRQLRPHRPRQLFETSGRHEFPPKITFADVAIWSFSPETGAMEVSRWDIAIATGALACVRRPTHLAAIVARTFDSFPLPSAARAKSALRFGFLVPASHSLTMGCDAPNRAPKAAWVQPFRRRIRRMTSPRRERSAIVRQIIAITVALTGIASQVNC
jgi:hypothetical protein